jgi:hypothetical protein
VDTLFQLDLVAALVPKPVFDPNLPVEFIGAFNSDLALSGTRGSGDFMIF